MVTGTIYGSNAPAGLRNTASSGAALLLTGAGTGAQRGTFSGETWISKGNLNNTETTLDVENGDLK
jgi:hypothetical protein